MGDFRFPSRMSRPEVATRALEFLGKKLWMSNPDTTIAVGINTRPSFEDTLAEAKVIIVQNGSPEMEQKTAYDIGKLCFKMATRRGTSEIPHRRGLSQ
ncbi:hypothetical protein [Leptospirillum ferriphilum]|uniref:hypothetical protein n=1 Tax=Leptospirillum ferriphilum TaxID=178606 RepID=UPI0012372B07|nr:hypothetical protein [Leptospirillum ferriphilum]